MTTSIIITLASCLFVALALWVNIWKRRIVGGFVLLKIICIGVVLGSMPLCADLVNVFSNFGVVDSVRSPVLFTPVMVTLVILFIIGPAICFVAYLKGRRIVFVGNDAIDDFKMALAKIGMVRDSQAAKKAIYTGQIYRAEIKSVMIWYQVKILRGRMTDFMRSIGPEIGRAE